MSERVSVHKSVVKLQQHLVLHLYDKNYDQILHDLRCPFPDCSDFEPMDIRPYVNHLNDHGYCLIVDADGYPVKGDVRLPTSTKSKPIEHVLAALAGGQGKRLKPADTPSQPLKLLMTKSQTTNARKGKETDSGDDDGDELPARPSKRAAAKRKALDPPILPFSKPLPAKARTTEKPNSSKNHNNDQPPAPRISRSAPNFIVEDETPGASSSAPTKRKRQSGAGGASKRRRTQREDAEEAVFTSEEEGGDDAQAEQTWSPKAKRSGARISYAHLVDDSDS